MNAVEKIKRSWWIVLSFIPFLNGFGFVYIGLKLNNKNWVIEGIAYEIPWLFYIIFFTNPVMPSKLVVIALVVMLASIVRSIWVAIKLADVYDNEDKYTVRPTVVNTQKDSDAKVKKSNMVSCCMCIVVIFIIFALVSIL